MQNAYLSTKIDLNSALFFKVENRIWYIILFIHIEKYNLYTSKILH